MKKLIAILFFLFFTSFIYSQSYDKYNFDVKKYPYRKFRVELPVVNPSEIKFYDFKYQMKGPYYFKGGVANWIEVRFKARFIIPTKWGIININIYLPPLNQNGFKFD